jgi:Zn-dependent protease with chaperone function
MNLTLSFWAMLLGRLAIEAGLLVVLAAGVQRWLRSPGARRTVWQAAVLAVALTWGSEVGGLRRWIPTVSTASVPNRRFEVRVALPAETVEPEVETPVIPGAVPAAGTATASIGPVWWPVWIWAAGMALVGLKAMAVRLWLGIAAGRNGRKITDVIFLERLERLRRRVGVGPVRVVEWPGLYSPIAFGSVRPTIAVPEGFTECFDPGEQETMLAHELAHLAAGDPFWLGVTDAVVALAWWHPAVWWLRQQLRGACESAADEASSLVPGGRVVLAELLVKLGRELMAPGMPHGLGVGSGLRSQLAKRVTVLLSESRTWRGESRVRLWMMRATAPVVAAVLLAIPGPGTAGPALLSVLLAAPLGAAIPTGEGKDSSPVRSDEAASPVGKSDAPLNRASIAGVTPATTGSNTISSVSGDASEASGRMPGFHREVGFVTITNAANGNPAADSLGNDFGVTLKPPGRSIARLQGTAGQDSVLTGTSSLDDGSLPEGITASTLITEVFELNSEKFETHLRKLLPPNVSRLDSTNRDIALRRFAAENEINADGTLMLPTQNRPAISFNAQAGELIVRATWADLKRIRHAVRDFAEARKAGSTDVHTRTFVVNLRTRTFRLNPEKFTDYLKAKFLQGPSDVSTNTDLALRRFAADQGMHFPDRKRSADGSLVTPQTNEPAIHFDPHAGNLLVRATEVDLDRIERALQQIPDVVDTSSSAEPKRQVVLEVKFLETTESGGGGLDLDWLFGQTSTNLPVVRHGMATEVLKNSRLPDGTNTIVDFMHLDGQSADLTPTQYTALIQRMGERSGTDVLSAPKLLTVSGQAAEVSVLEAKSIATGVTTNRGGLSYNTQPCQVGPTVGLVAVLEGNDVRLKVSARYTEFLGYDAPKAGTEVQVSTPDGKSLTGQIPFPHFRVRTQEAEAITKLRDTVALRGPMVTNVVILKDKVPGLGDIPVLGRLFRSESTNAIVKRMYVFVTPIEVDAAGRAK